MSSSQRKAYKAAWIAAKRASQKPPKGRSYFDSSEDEQDDENQPRHVKNLKTNVNLEERVVNQQDDTRNSTITASQSNILMATNLDSDNDSTVHSDTNQLPLEAVQDDISNYSILESPKKTSLLNDIKEWALEYHITHSALNGLLEVLRKNDIKSNGARGKPMPKSARTVLGTPTSISTRVISGMQYVYFGFACQLLKIVTTFRPESISLSLNIDGLPLFKSSSSSVWPVLCRVENITTPIIFAVALALGVNKPSNTEFLRECVDELVSLSMDGLDFEQKVIPVKVSQIICDAPAKAMVKAIKQFNGYHGCDKCTQRGTHVNGRMLFTEATNFQMRTDRSLRDKLDPEHHTGISEFCRLDIDMANSFPIDYMHQVCLGVMKKLLVSWFTLHKGSSRLPQSQREAVNKRLLKLRPYTPVDFQRKPRCLSEIARFKATELRTFLLYTGKIVMNGVLCPEKYQHFLCFSVAITILVSSKLTSKHRELAHKLLVKFVTNCQRLYGENFLIYNVHSLLHLAEQTKHFGDLNRSAAFPYENYMQEIKRCVRTGHSPLAQIANRLSEKGGQLPPIPVTLKKKYSIKPPNNCYITESGKVVELLNSVKLNGGGRAFQCREFGAISSFFETPCPSKLIGVHIVDPRVTFRRVYRESKLRAKCFKMVCENEVVAQEIIHTIDR